jgi:DNA-binding PadR family transcriptional regulator
MKRPSYRRSPLALAVLGTLYEGPMHPYRIQRLIKERGKDQVINVQQRASIYQTIERLHHAGLIEIVETTRDDRWPERTIYQLTDEGRATARRWLCDMLSAPTREFPEFPAALAFLPLLTSKEALVQLEARISAIEVSLRQLHDELTTVGRDLPRLFLIEAEYQETQLGAELAWVRSVVDDLRVGRLTWSEEWLRQIAAAHAVSEETERA